MSKGLGRFREALAEPMSTEESQEYIEWQKKEVEKNIHQSELDRLDPWSNPPPKISDQRLKNIVNQK